MLFNSFVFWSFFGVVLVIYSKLQHRAQNRLLLLASYVFYGYWDYRYLSLIIFSTVVDYLVAIKLDKESEPDRRKRLLWVSISVNLGLLAFFKYCNFFIHEMDALLHALGVPVSLPVLNVVLPVGISFYTFQTLSYTIDVFRGENKPTRQFLDFALYVSFFPQLVAGPIERSYRLLPQVLRPRVRRGSDVVEGAYHILIGLFKKVVVADNMSVIVNHVFSQPISDLSGTEVMIGVYAFAFQIYGDFSGYSSIAQGVAKWLGFDLSWNFKMPYFARTPSEFWRRWHITLSSWLRDYLYIPLGGNRGSKYSTLRNLMLTMLLGGLWHGAGWTFVAWGLYHGLLLAVFRVIKLGQVSWISGFLNRRLGKILAVFLFFQLTCVGWLLFRAESLGQAWTMFGLIFTDQNISLFTLYSLAMMLFFVGPLILLEIWIERSGDLLKVIHSHWTIQFGIYFYFCVMLWVFPPLTNQVFIYFQF